ncbi:MAG TPA: hypothetical protein DF296_02665 [Candidatus Margulisbacteria bacterium]|nr:MAG: hypothetical protein A2X43_05850 [Candidatus Margulisbacteria bacterium GWD2_39_127]HCT84082.1 hypothetical protein [Candidatus Margulisiibacteriota bacterium]
MEITEIENNTTNKNVNSRLTTDNVTHQSSPVTRHPSPTYYDDEIDLIEYIKIIWKYKWFIILVTALAVIGTYFYTKSLPKIYSSTVTVIIPQEEGGGSNLSAMLGGMGFGNLVAGNSNSELIVEVLKSRRMAEKISRHFNLPRHYDGVITAQKIAKIAPSQASMVFAVFIKKRYIDQDGKPTVGIDNSKDSFVIKLDPPLDIYQDKLTKLYKNEHRIDMEIKAVNMLMKNTKIESTKSGLIKLTVEDTTPAMTARIANYYVLAMDAMNDELQITTKKPMLKVLDTAIVPEKKVRPKTVQNVAIALVIVGFMSIFLSFFSEYIRKINYK